MADNNTELIAEAHSHIAQLAEGFPPDSVLREKILAGDVEDPRVSLIVRLTAALEASEREMHARELHHFETEKMLSDAGIDPEHPAHTGHEHGGAYARAAALEAGDPDWMNATGGQPEPTFFYTLDYPHRPTSGPILVDSEDDFTPIESLARAHELAEKRMIVSDAADRCVVQYGVLYKVPGQ